jgi:hypothetical protein
MQLRKIFEFQIDRPIEGVIKADDDASLRTEVEEYVITDELELRLDDFLDAYIDYQNANGVWISGFFGSGKSHLLKMIALLLAGRTFDGLDVSRVFQNKCEKKNKLLAAKIAKAVAIPSESILFNIDQKADVISKKDVDALLAVFVKVFDQKCGYYGKQAYIAHFERQLDEDRLLVPFKEAFERHAKMTWDDGRERVIRFGSSIDVAYNEITGEKVTGVINKHRDDYKLSIEDFADQVRKYIDSKAKDFRLNFFVDEVGQYVAKNDKLMVNLQTIAESLATKCRGRAWIIVTAQEEISAVIGELTKEEGNDFSKIRARFANRMKLTSTNVAEVIQKRLLAKTQEGVKALLPLYERESGNFRTLFDFTESQKYRNFENEDHFCNCYPFIPYQFELFQLAIRGLSTHNAFEGKHSSVGERSMLGVFQEVAIQIADNTIGELATFDLMYKGISSTLKSHLLSVRAAEKNLDNELAVRLLKALLLVKYVKEFKASVPNLCVLMISRFDQDLTQLRKDVEEALNLLENQIYIQRNGDYYEFLTDEEKDVEQEIKNTEVDATEVADELHRMIFDNVLKTKKLRYDANKRDFSFTRRLDDKIYGREYELGVHVISPFHEHSGNPEAVRMTYLGRTELTVLLPSDDRLIRDITLMKQTAKYVGINYATAKKANVKQIIGNKNESNRLLQVQIVELLKRLMGKAQMFVAGTAVESTKEDPNLRIHDGFEKLVEQTYTNLPMLRGVNFTEAQIDQCLNESSDGLFGNDAATITEPETEMLGSISRNVGKGIRPTMKMLVDDFEKRPFGWPLPAIQCVLAKLVARGKVEIRCDGELLEDGALSAALKNTQKHGNMVLEPQIEFGAGAVRKLKEFFSQFFDTPARANEARALAEETANAFQKLHGDLQLLATRHREYPFLSTLSSHVDDFDKLTRKSYKYFLSEFDAESERLLDLKEQALDPVRRFMAGPQAALFAEARSFINHNATNFSYLDGDEHTQLKQLLDDPKCYVGNGMKQAKTLLDNLRSRLETLASEARAAAEQAVTSKVQKLAAIDGYDKLSDQQKQQIDSIVDETIEQIKSQPLIAVVKEAATRFEQKGFTDILGKVNSWTQKPDEPKAGDSENGDSETKPKPAWKPPVEFIGLSHLSVSFERPWLESETDIDAYLGSLRQSMLDAIKDGKRIQV